jgi:hypothetical protein
MSPGALRSTSPLASSRQRCTPARRCPRSWIPNRYAPFLLRPARNTLPRDCATTRSSCCLPPTACGPGRSSNCGWTMWTGVLTDSWFGHTKTGLQSDLPFGPGRRRCPAGLLEARTARHRCPRDICPYQGAVSIFQSRIQPVSAGPLASWRAADVSPAGKCGPHTFRHARAVSLLRASATTKTIGDLLGHRSAEVNEAISQARHR